MIYGILKNLCAIISLFVFLLCKLSLRNSFCFIYIQVKTVYIEFLMHCYIDTDVEIKEIYTKNHMWTVFQNFLQDVNKVLYTVLWNVTICQ